MKAIDRIRACFLGLVALCLLGNTLVSAICSIDEGGHEQPVAIDLLAGTTAFVHAPHQATTDEGCTSCKDLFNAEHCCAHGVAPLASVASGAHIPPTGFVLAFVEFDLPANTASDVFRPPILA